MKHFVFQILDGASALGRAASRAHPSRRTGSSRRAPARPRLPRPRPSDRRPARWARARHPVVNDAWPSPPGPSRRRRP